MGRHLCRRFLNRILKNDSGHLPPCMELEALMCLVARYFGEYWVKHN